MFVSVYLLHISLSVCVRNITKSIFHRVVTNLCSSSPHRCHSLVDSCCVAINFHQQTCSKFVQPLFRLYRLHHHHCIHCYSLAMHRQPLLDMMPLALNMRIIHNANVYVIYEMLIQIYNVAIRHWCGRVTRIGRTEHNNTASNNYTSCVHFLGTGQKHSTDERRALTTLGPLHPKNLKKYKKYKKKIQHMDHSAQYSSSYYTSSA